MRLSLIDIDGMFYHSCRDTLEESISIFKEKLENCLLQTNANYWSGFITKGRCFRYNIDPNYKFQRSKYSRPKWLNALREWAISEYDLNICDKWEADDAVNYWFNKNLHIADDGKIEPKETFDDALDYCKQMKLDLFHYEPLEVIIASPDKDLLQSIVGKHFNYTYKLEDKDNPDSVIKGWWVETSILDSVHFKIRQLISGDISDNVITPFPENCGISNEHMMIGEVLQGYIAGLYYRTPSGMDKFKEGFGPSKGVYEFQKNYRLLHLLDCNEDFYREIGELPESPTILPVIREEKVDEFKDVSF